MADPTPDTVSVDTRWDEIALGDVILWAVGAALLVVPLLLTGGTNGCH